MELYFSIGLHSNNGVLMVLDERDRTVFAKRMPNDLTQIISALRSCPGTTLGAFIPSKPYAGWWTTFTILLCYSGSRVQI